MPNQDPGVWSEAMPISDPIALEHEAAVLREHAKLVGIYYQALIDSGIPEELAQTLIEQFCEDALASPGDEEEVEA